MGEKKTPRLTPEQNEARQAARALKREEAKDARLVAELAIQLYVHDRAPGDEVPLAYGFLARAKEYFE